MATGGWSIIGTDNGVGKTVVSAAIAALARAAGREVAIAKPIQTGPQDDSAEADRLVGARVSRPGWRLSRPLDPALAAELGGERLYPGEVVQWTVQALTGVDIGVVDTCGGAAVEIKEGFNNSDLAAAIGLSALVVCRPGAGTLSHTLLTVDHLRARHVDIVGIVVDRFPVRPTIAEAANMAELERLTRYPLVGVVPEMRLDPDTFVDSVSRGLSSKLGGQFDRAAFLAEMAALV
ncbi:MAG: dethiobiotin synthase [Candidatus Dormibacteria bacterium]